MIPRVITFGEIMLRLSPPGYQRFTQATSFEACYGGGEANVAVSLAGFGIRSAFVSRLPDNDLGRACRMYLMKHGIDTTHILPGGDRMGIYFLETGAVSRPSKVIYDRAHSSFSRITRGMFDWERILEGASWFHWTGITPAVSQGAADACREAIETAGRKGITVSCDLNYRRNLWKYGKSAGEVMPALIEGCDVVIGNEEDAELVLGISPKGIDITGGHVEADAYHSVSGQIMQRFPRVKKVATTLRGSVSASHNTWSGVLYDGKTLFTAPDYQITHIVDRVGGGDAFAAGLIYGLLTWGKDDERALRFATAASCLKHTIPGDFNLVTVHEVEKLMGGDASGRVSR
ncbi:MAG TPA: sugar kinase [Bacteroidetes bacterium]|nr:sugar kinase [Bacteroidota bacterium]